MHQKAEHIHAAAIQKRDSDVTRGRHTVSPILFRNVSKPQGFTTPLQQHGAGRSVIEILTMLIESSETLIEHTVQSEEEARDAYLKDVRNTEQAIHEKRRQVAVFQQSSGEATAQLQEAKTSLKGCQIEIAQIEQFLVVVQQRCATLVSNFDSNQRLRTDDIENLRQARATLLGAVASAPAREVSQLQLRRKQEMPIHSDDIALRGTMSVTHRIAYD